MRQRTFAKKTPRVLIEDADGALRLSDFTAFEAAGLGVTMCSGPEPGHGFDCPAVAGFQCPLVEAADAIMFTGASRRDRRIVLDAVRASRPDVPVLVEVTRRPPGDRDELPPGCIPLPMPSSIDAQVEAVRRAAIAATVR